MLSTGPWLESDPHLICSMNILNPKYKFHTGLVPIPSLTMTATGAVDRVPAETGLLLVEKQEEGNV